MGYALRLSPEERTRYRLMADAARAAETGEWASAGIDAGARVADIGCGPGAMLRVLAETVGVNGRADRVDHDAEAVAAAQEAMVQAGLADAADLARWEVAFQRLDQRTERPWMNMPVFVAVGRVPAV